MQFDGEAIYEGRFSSRDGEVWGLHGPELTKEMFYSGEHRAVKIELVRKL